MAITTDGKVNEMLKLGKADNTVSMEYSNVQANHSVALVNRNSTKLSMENSKENMKRKKDAFEAASPLHPIKKIKAFREYRDAKRQYKIKKNDYKIAKLQLKNAQMQLRSIRAEIKRQYSAMKQNERINNRMQKIQNDHYVTPSLSDMLEYTKQSASYLGQVYHIDKSNSAQNTRISAPRDELYKNINKTYAKHLKEKAKAKSKELLKDTLDMAQQIGDHIKDVGKGLKLAEPEVEM